VRSNWRPAWMEISAFRTTLAHGPGQPEGGVKENGLGEKSANATLLNKGTMQGVVLGRGTAGSAVAVLAEPITSPGGGMVCAEIALVMSMRHAIANIFEPEKNVKDLRLVAKKTCITTSVVRTKF
jgi:hypothetical protein